MPFISGQSHVPFNRLTRSLAVSYTEIQDGLETRSNNNIQRNYHNKSHFTQRDLSHVFKLSRSSILLLHQMRDLLLLFTLKGIYLCLRVFHNKQQPSLPHHPRHGNLMDNIFLSEIQQQQQLFLWLTQWLPVTFFLTSYMRRMRVVIIMKIRTCIVTSDS